MSQNHTQPSPRTRLVSFTRVGGVAPGGEVVVTLPPIPPAFRAYVVESGTGEDMYLLPGKRFNEPGDITVRICLGEHDCANGGGATPPFIITQTGVATDLSTCPTKAM